MTGYLARLAARAGGRSALAAPRLPARFEPVGGDEQTEFGPADGADEVTHRGEWGPDVTAPRARAGSEARSTDATEQRRVIDRVRADRATGAPWTGRAGRPGSDGSPAVVRHDESAARPRDRADRAAGVPEQPGRAVLADLGRDPSAVVPPRPDPLAPQPGRAPDARGDPPARAVAAPRAVGAPAPESASAGDRRSPDGDGARHPGPDVVRVTIGRVEVRATLSAPATSPTPDRPDPPPSSTLHDYLAGRSR